MSVDNDPTGRRLRVGLFTTGHRPRWQRKVLVDLAASEDSELALVILVEPDAPAIGLGGLDRLYRAVDRLALARFPAATDGVDVSDLFEGREVLPVRFAGEGESIGEADADWIRGHDLDVLICLGLEPRGDRVAGLARHGTWAYRFGESRASDLESVGVRDVLGGRLATTASLVLVGEGRALFNARLKVNRLSSRRHCDHVGAVASAFVGRLLRRLRRDGALSPVPGPMTPVVPPDVAPGFAEMAGLAARFVGRLAAEALHRALHDDQWVLACSTQGTWDGFRPDFSTMSLLVPPPDRFWADPFPIAIDGKTYIYFEDYPYETRKGEIAVLEIDDKGRAGESRRALVRDYHLSYPFVFWWEDQLYMIPETTNAGNVELYLCSAPPDQWEFNRTLLRGSRAADVTLAEHDGLWWLFGSIPAEGAHNDLEELHLFHAPTPLGPWSPHPANPVKSDVASARPAGRPYQVDGIWYRPAQDCTVGYGHSIVLNRVTRWDLGGYEEVEAGRIDPGWAPGVDRTHTFNALGRFFVGDARVARRRFFSGRER